MKLVILTPPLKNVFPGRVDFDEALEVGNNNDLVSKDLRTKTLLSLRLYEFILALSLCSCVGGAANSCLVTRSGEHGQEQVVSSHMVSWRTKQGRQQRPCSALGT